MREFVINLVSLGFDAWLPEKQLSTRICFYKILPLHQSIHVFTFLVSVESSEKAGKRILVIYLSTRLWDHLNILKTTYILNHFT